MNDDQQPHQASSMLFAATVFLHFRSVTELFISAKPPRNSQPAAFALALPLLFCRSRTLNYT
jgi:hypothetical protein